MDSIFECPVCGEPMRLDDDDATIQHVTCPSCDQVVELPSHFNPVPDTSPSPFIATPRRTRQIQKRRSSFPVAFVFLGLLFLGLGGAAAGLFVYQAHLRQTAEIEKETARKRDEERAKKEAEAQRLLAEQAEREAERKRAAELARQLQAKASKAQPEASTDDDPDSDVDVDVDFGSPEQQLANELEQTGKSCETFQFLPRNASQYKRLRHFIRLISAAQSTVNRPASKSDAGDPEEQNLDVIDPKDRELLSEKVQVWQKKMKTQMHQTGTSDPRRLSQINRFARMALDRGNADAQDADAWMVGENGDEEFADSPLLDLPPMPVIFYGCRFLSKKMPDSVLKLENVQSYVLIAPSEKTQALADDEYRLFIVETPDKPVHNRIIVEGEGFFKLTRAKLLGIFDPLAS